LSRILPDAEFNVYAKIEKCNPGGSIKDRPALNMLIGKIRSGELEPGRSVVIESSSGNMAIGLAQVCRYFGIGLICVVDARTSRQSIEILRVLGATVEVVDKPDADSGQYLPARLRRVCELAASIPHSYWPDQYSNPLNATAHEQTMREIDEALGGRVDYLLCAASSCGTLRGCADYIRARGMATQVVAVDAEGSVLFSDDQDGALAPRLIPGHGAAVRSRLLDPSAVRRVIHVSDLEAVVACRRLVRTEAVLAGGSSGAILAALGKMADDIPRGASCAVILADGAESYLDTIYSDAWVREHFGDVSHLWEGGDVYARAGAS
jgi:cysteine synthase A